MSSYDIIEYEKWDNIPNINPNILRGIYSCGFENPSPIQSKAISPIIEKKNIIAQAQSGTGKTCAFVTGGLYLLNFKSYLLVGGTSVSDDIKNLNNSVPHIIVACPGRLMDIFQKNVIQLKHVHSIIIDEADEMLSFGFKNQILNILKETM